MKKCINSRLIKNLFLLVLIIITACSNNKFYNIVENTDTPRIYKKFEVSFEIPKMYINPYDFNEIDVTAVFTSPEGEQISVPAFWYEGFMIDTIAEKIVSNETGKWMVRFTPTIEGMWTYLLYAKDKDGNISSKPRTFEAKEAEQGTKGFIRIHPEQNNRYYFDYSQESFYVIGFNADINTFYRPSNQGFCWDWDSNSRYFPSSTHDSNHQMDELALYRNYMSFKETIVKSSLAGANAMRLFNDAYYTPVEISKEMNVPGFGKELPGFEIGKYHQGMSWMIDNIYEIAEGYGVAIRHTVWAGNHDINWGGRQYAVAQNDDLIKRRLRYQIARWGYSTCYWATTYFNELSDPQNLIGYSESYWEKLTNWLRNIDPYNHIVSDNITPYLGNVTAGGIDDYAPHFYDKEIKKCSNWQEDISKPMIYEEFGAHGQMCTLPLDADSNADFPRMTFFQALVGNRSGGLTWWTKPYYGYLDLYNKMYNGISAFLKNENIITDGPWEKAELITNLKDAYDINAMVSENQKKLFIYIIRTHPLEYKENTLCKKGELIFKMPEGSYQVEWWNPISGEIIKKTETVAGKNGETTLTIPETSLNDLAGKLLKVN